MPDDPEPARPVTRWPMYVFLSGVVVCLFFSTLCHTYCCIGARDAERMWRLDYLGIAVLIVSSFYPMVHYSYYCLPGWRDMYITGITSLGCLAAIPTLLTAFQKKEYGPLRALSLLRWVCLVFFPFFNKFLVWRIVPTPRWKRSFWKCSWAAAILLARSCTRRAFLNVGIRVCSISSGAVIIFFTF